MQVISVNVGQPRLVRVGGRSMRSAIAKQPVDGPVAVRTLGLDGDAQADTRLHGGVRKAVYAYAQEHYAYWRTVRAQAGAALWGDDDGGLAPGAVGENLTVAGLREEDLWIGDRLLLPDCRLVVTEPRYPCTKFSAAMGFAQAASLMWQSGWCGSYLAVLDEGTVRAGDAVRIEPGARDLALPALFRSKAPPRAGSSRAPR